MIIVNNIGKLNDYCNLHFDGTKEKRLYINRYEVYSKYLL